MGSLKDMIEELEKQEIYGALKESDWNMARAARRLGITARMISYKINKYGIRIKEVRWIVDARKEERNENELPEPCTAILPSKEGEIK
jgi:transposase-like protein